MTLKAHIVCLSIALLSAGSSTLAQASLPAIAGVSDAMNFKSGLAASTWISIFGTNLAATTRDWTGAPEFNQNKLPFTLDGVSVTINNKPAAVSFVSPGQVNVLAPADAGVGPMYVVVKNGNGAGPPFYVIADSALPALYAPFVDANKNLFVTAVASNGDLLGKVGLDPRVKRALQPLETVSLFGTGFGSTIPAAPTDTFFGRTFPFKDDPYIQFGAVSATITFAGMVAPGLCQFNVIVPYIPEGDTPIQVNVTGHSTRDHLLVSIKRAPGGPPPADLGGGIVMEFAPIPTGEFMMGCSPGDTMCNSDEKPSHGVQITNPFEMGKFEVTQAQWQALMGKNPSQSGGNDWPVDPVYWDDIQEFLKRLNAKNDGYRYRLPTEAEWEYAARAGTTGPYYGDPDAIAWYGNNSRSAYSNYAGMHPVGHKQANAWGLYDMLGNVSEFCLVTDPAGNSVGRAIRGGNFYSGLYDLRVSFRTSENMFFGCPSIMVPDCGLGMRCAREKMAP